MASPTNTHDHHGCEDNSQGASSSSPSPSSPSRSGSHYQHEARRSTTAPVALSSDLHEQPPSLIGLMLLQQHHGGLLLPFDGNGLAQGQAGEEETHRSRDLRNDGVLAAPSDRFRSSALLISEHRSDQPRFTTMSMLPRFTARASTRKNPAAATARSESTRNDGGGIQSCALFRRPEMIMTRAQERRGERERIIGVLDEAMRIMEDSDELFFDCPRQDQIVGTRQSSGGAAAAAFRPSLDRSSRSPASGRRLQ
mmetsp:Transcript_5161/g.15094  ORF Transcript_5161/g.15094 Transcript_5161/m.15094 type:complete len:253 (-) Transcript_5161:1047-1805(-)